VAKALDAADRRELLTQLWISRLLAPIWIPVFTGIMVFVMRWKLVGAESVREEYAALRRQSDAPVLVCANHLTMFDSFAIAWSLGGMGTYLRHFSWVPWNTPEEVNFASTWWKRILVYLLKCVPVKRGSNRADVAKTLEKVAELLRRGESVLIFPEGGRSRTGRVDTEAATYGVGRLVGQVPGCRVLCIYLRGRNQETWTDTPAHGDAFDVYAASLEPKTDHKGLRASVDISKQIVARLAEMEQRHFDDRQ
jgi:1-acyl-sn-glycerol-3-phosphate acyltransferase